MIVPTIGRVLWYYPHGTTEFQPWACFVAFVHSDTEVNIGGVTDKGLAFNEVDVMLDQRPFDEIQASPPMQPFVCWMPYQQKVAGSFRSKD